MRSNIYCQISIFYHCSMQFEIYLDQNKEILIFDKQILELF